MAGSRTIRILVALVIAMTIGALALKLLETSPAPLTASDLMALNPQTDYKTYVPVKLDQWRNIVIHSTGAEGADIVDRVHFVVDADGEGLIVHPTELWRQQVPGQHVAAPGRGYNATSIGICLRGNFSHQPPSRAQMDALVNLVCTLQQMCRISVQNVYMYSDLSTGPTSPGKEFPRRQFDELLLRLR